MSIEFRLERTPFSSFGIELRARSDNGFLNPVSFSDVEDGMIIPPALSMKPGDAQQLMDELWRCGIRPTEGSGSAGSLAATQSHLEDMKKIAFKQLGIK